MRVLKIHIAGTRGGYSRLQVLLMLQKKPHNINEISKKLGMDYKTVQHHIRVLEKSGLIISGKKKYGNAYDLSTLLKSNRNLIRELGNMGKTR